MKSLVATGKSIACVVFRFFIFHFSFLYVFVFFFCFLLEMELCSGELRVSLDTMIVFLVGKTKISCVMDVIILCFFYLFIFNFLFLELLFTVGEWMVCCGSPFHISWFCSVPIVFEKLSKIDNAIYFSCLLKLLLPLSLLSSLHFF